MILALFAAAIRVVPEQVLLVGWTDLQSLLFREGKQKLPFKVIIEVYEILIYVNENYLK